jgi:retron-type reverse transcriptase
VLIPKAGTSEMRKLGVPVVMDRIVGTSMHSILEEIFDPGFTESNFGFRWGRSQHQAIWQLQSNRPFQTVIFIWLNHFMLSGHRLMVSATERWHDYDNGSKSETYKN